MLCCLALRCGLGVASPSIPLPGVPWPPSPQQASGTFDGGGGGQLELLLWMGGQRLEVLRNYNLILPLNSTFSIAAIITNIV